MTPPFGIAAYPIPTAAAHMNASSEMTRASLFLRRIVVDSIRPSMKLQSPACVMIPTFPVSGYSATSGLEFVETIKDPHHVIGLGADLMRATRPMWQGNDISFTEFAGRGHAYARPALPDGQRAAHRFRGGEHEPDVMPVPTRKRGRGCGWFYMTSTIGKRGSASRQAALWSPPAGTSSASGLHHSSDGEHDLGQRSGMSPDSPKGSQRRRRSVKLPRRAPARLPHLGPLDPTAHAAGLLDPFVHLRCLDLLHGLYLDVARAICASERRWWV